MFKFQHIARFGSAITSGEIATELDTPRCCSDRFQQNRSGQQRCTCVKLHAIGIYQDRLLVNSCHAYVNAEGRLSSEKSFVMSCGLFVVSVTRICKIWHKLRHGTYSGVSIYPSGNPRPSRRRIIKCIEVTNDSELICEILERKLASLPSAPSTTMKLEILHRARDLARGGFSSLLP